MENLNLKGLSLIQIANVMLWTMFNQAKAHSYIYHLEMGLQPKYAYIKANSI